MWLSKFSFGLSLKINKRAKKWLKSETSKSQNLYLSLQSWLITLWWLEPLFNSPTHKLSQMKDGNALDWALRNSVMSWIYVTLVFHVFYIIKKNDHQKSIQQYWFPSKRAQERKESFNLWAIATSLFVTKFSSNKIKGKKCNSQNLWSNKRWWQVISALCYEGRISKGSFQTRLTLQHE